MNTSFEDTSDVARNGLLNAALDRVTHFVVDVTRGLREPRRCGALAGRYRNLALSHAGAGAAGGRDDQYRVPAHPTAPPVRAEGPAGSDGLTSGATV
jgi:hypothetical protein